MKNHHEILLELLNLRETNYDLFIDKLYYAITVDFNSYFKEDLARDIENKKTVQIMINHYEKKEDYEKCQVLISLLNNDS